MEMEFLDRQLVVIPAFNEESSLEKTLRGLQRLPEEFELLVVNDGSADRTSWLAHHWRLRSRLPLHVVDLTANCGIGGAVQTGYLFAEKKECYDFVVQFDADGQHDVDALVALVEHAREKGLDLCIGSRFLGNRRGGFRSTRMRRTGIRFLASYIRWLTGAAVTDPTSGFRCAGPRAWRAFARCYPDDYPEPESLYWSIRNGLHVGEIPVRMYARRSGRSSIHTARPLYYMLKVTLAIMVDRVRKKEGFLHEC